MKITKKQAAAFCKSAAALIQSFGFTPTGPSCAHPMRCWTDCGPFLVTPPDPEMEKGSYCVAINGRFEMLGARNLPHGVNVHSGKWNVLGSDPDHVLRQFAANMRHVNARAMTREQAATMEARDAAERAKWDRYREEEANPPTPPPPPPLPTEPVRLGPAPTRPPAFHPTPPPAAHPAIALARDLAAVLRRGLPQDIERLALAEIDDSPAGRRVDRALSEAEDTQAELDRANREIRDLEKEVEELKLQIRELEA